jgi:hypothetical protein
MRLEEEEREAGWEGRLTEPRKVPTHVISGSGWWVDDFRLSTLTGTQGFAQRKRIGRGFGDFKLLPGMLMACMLAAQV